MAVTIYKAGKYRILAGKKISKNSEWITLPSNAKIKANGKWYNLSFSKKEPTDLPDIETPDISIPEFPELTGPTLTEETLVHENVTEPTTGNVWYMTPSGNGNMSGTSWESAMSASQIHALLLTVSTGDRIYMSEGDYGTINRPMTIPEGVSIYGGFIENDYSWNTRNSFTNPSVWNGDGTFALFDLKSENTSQVIDGITCNNFLNEIGESGNCTFRNMVLVGGNFNITGNLTNSKVTNCELTSGTGDKVLVSNTESKNCTFSGNLSNSTISLSEGELSAGDTSNCYITDCSKVTLNSLINSEIVNYEVTVTNEVNNVKCYDGNLTAGSCTDCIVTGNLTCKSDAINCQVGIDLTSNEGSCTDCIVTGNITTLNKCTNCKSNGLICDTSENCVCYENYCSYEGKNNKIINSNINQGAKPYQTDDSTQCDYFILNGFLYYKNSTQVGTETGWTHISGHSSYSSYSSYSTYSYAYGICNGYLYQLYQTEVTQVGTSSGWTAISGFSSSYYDYYAYGIRNGYLCALKETTATQVGEETGWTAVSGYSYSSIDYAHGIRNGYLYALQGTTVRQVGEESGWTAISGYSSYNPSVHYACGIRNGYLYRLMGTKATRVGEETGWTAISSSSSSTYSYAYGICNGYLYALMETKATRVGEETGWTAISGYSYSDAYSSSSSSSSYAYGICNGYLYALMETKATRVGEETGWTAIYGYYYSYSSYTYYAYGIRNGYLYALQGTELKKIGIKLPYLTNSIIANCNSDSGYFIETSKTKVYNSNISLKSTNSLIVNCEGEIESSIYSTIVNSKSTVNSGEYNVYWNNEGSIPPENNAQSEYFEKNLLTLEYDNSIAKFNSTGYSSSKGIQDLNPCPDPVSDPEGYNNYINSFGNWKPQTDSFLIGKGTKVEGVETDINGNTRPETPTLGAYEG